MFVGVALAVLLAIFANVDGDWGRSPDAARPDLRYHTRHSHPALAGPVVGHDTSFAGPDRRLLCHLARRHQPEIRTEGASTRRSSWWDRTWACGVGGMVRDVLLPAALPYAISGARIGWASCWRAVVAAGLVLCVAGENPGFFTDGAGGLLESPELLAGLLNLALVGTLVEAAFGLLERYTIIRWGMKTRA